MVSPNNGRGDQDDDRLAELNRQAAAAMDAYNREPDPEMGGLSPDQVFRLLHTEWGAADSPIQFDENVPFDLLTDSGYFRDSRTLLLAVAKAGGVKATAKGNLPRSLVADLMEVVGDESERRATRRVNKVINEQDYFSLHLARIFCEVAGLLRRVKGRFLVPKKFDDLLHEEAAGRLYRTLFVAFFRKFNLAYLVPWGPELPAVQTCAAYTLYRLGFAAREWRALTDLYPEILLPPVRAEIEQAVAGLPYHEPEDIATRLLIHPLIEWNLLEAQTEKTEYHSEPVAVRIAPLYDAFFQFRL